MKNTKNQGAKVSSKTSKTSKVFIPEQIEVQNETPVQDETPNPEMVTEVQNETPSPEMVTEVQNETPVQIEKLPTEFDAEQKEQLLVNLSNTKLTFEQIINEISRISALNLDSIEIKGVRVISQTRELVSGTDKVSLSEKEFGLLNLLFKNQNQPLSRNEIAEQVWNDTSGTKGHSIDVSMNHLRSKLEKVNLSRNTIATVIGKGYMMKSED